MPSQQTIDERKANLPLPDQPPQASDWNSADERNVNVGSGGNAALTHEGLGTSSTNDPAIGGGDLSSVGRQGVEGLDGPPNDAVTRNKKDAAGLADTTGKDYGYPAKNDPSSGIQK